MTQLCFAGVCRPEHESNPHTIRVSKLYITDDRYLHVRCLRKKLILHARSGRYSITEVLGSNFNQPTYVSCGIYHSVQEAPALTYLWLTSHPP